MKKESISISKIKNGKTVSCEDEVALEAVYQVYLNGNKEFRVSCTPEDLEELITGRLYTGGLIQRRQQIKDITVLEEQQEIHVKINKAPEQRNAENEFLKNIQTEKSAVQDEVVSDPEKLFSVADQIFEQPGELFRETGCAHSCVFWKEGEIRCRFEDIGRHNALDKVAGSMLLQDISPQNGAIFTSGRISADYLEKIIRTGVRVVVSRAAVTEAAVRLARENRITVYGFVRKGSGNIYSCSKFKK